MNDAALKFKDDEAEKPEFAEAIAPSPAPKKRAPPVKSKLYKRESRLKFVRPKEAKKLKVTKKHKSAKKHGKVFGVTGDTAVNIATSSRMTPAAPKPSSDDGKPKRKDSKLKFRKQGKEVKQYEKLSKLEQKHERYSQKADKAREKLPSKTTKVEQRFYAKKTNKDGKTEVKLRETKIRFDKEAIPFEKAAWNQPKKQSLPERSAVSITTIGINKLHYKVHQVEHENVGVKAAHKAELMGENALREGKKAVQSAYRFHKNTPYRQAAKLEAKTLKTRVKLDYQKALRDNPKLIRDNPKLKSNAVSRFMQKRQIQRKYAAALRNSGKNVSKSGKILKATKNIAHEAGQVVTNIIRRNPIFMLKLGLLLLIVFSVMSIFSMCMSIFSGGTGIFGAIMYSADYEDIDDASILYTELETDLRVYILEIEDNYPGFDEYRVSTGSIGHDPFALMAFLTAVYHDFTFAEVEATIRQIFGEHYALEIVPEVEIRWRWEQVGWEQMFVGLDPTGNPMFVWIPVFDWMPYEWHILNATLTVTPFEEILLSLMDEEQTQHFELLMMSLGARQFVGNPFDFDWLPHVTSLYGYRVHPISGDRRFHWGLDVALPTGTPIRAGFDGVIVAVGYAPASYGNFVVIENSDGIQARYAHCHEVFVTLGQVVERGEIIATVGTTGASTGPHLHIEIARNGRRLNPMFFLETVIN